VYYAIISVAERKDKELTETYAKTLRILYPVGLIEPTRLGGIEAFSDVKEVPTTIVLDRGGRIVWRKTGLAKSDELRAAMGPYVLDSDAPAK
jgi:hypothetical protein